ncbi:hypothetical protein [Deinococcus yunweiensis]|uniref:hypothetical protein n=1 Tax=Deinococcus yunweiensis TaxID=367282 RepID=UPI00398F8D81
MLPPLAIGMPLNTAEVAALRTLFPAATFTLGASGTAYGGVASSTEELHAIRLAMQHQRHYTLNHGLPENGPIRDTSCEVCGMVENTAFYPGGAGEYLCPTHSRSRALTAAAHDHLTSVLTATITDWIRHWGQVTSPGDVADAIAWVTEALAATPEAERLAQVTALLAATPET